MMKFKWERLFISILVTAFCGLCFADYNNSATYPDTVCTGGAYTLHVSDVQQPQTYNQLHTAQTAAFAASIKNPSAKVIIKNPDINCKTTWRANSTATTSSRSSSSSSLNVVSSSTASSVSTGTLNVSKSGSINSDCKIIKCTTIQRALDLARAGDTIMVEAGIYNESSLTSNSPCYWFSAPVSLCIRNSGTLTQPIKLIAAPGHVVIIDNASARVGIHLNSHDYITIKGFKFINNFKNAIANVSQAGNDVPDIEMLSVGVRVEDNYFDTVTTNEAGDNISAIGPWSSKDWVIRNNFIRNVTAGSGIRAYGVINALVENNTMVDVREGIMWKDHFVTDAETRGKYFESEIRYNDISANEYGILIQIRGSETPEAGNNYIHHNILRGIKDGEAAGLRIAMAGAYSTSGFLHFQNNTIDCRGSSQNVGVTIDSSTDVKLTGNIFINCNLAIETIKYSDTKVATITESNFNVFVDNFKTVMDRYSGTSKFYYEFDDWKIAKNSESVSLAIDNPDNNSKALSLSDARIVGYKPELNSPILNMTAAGAAGAYQTGSELIGVNF
jgi:hypothetical protein